MREGVGVGVLWEEVVKGLRGGARGGVVRGVRGGVEVGVFVFGLG